MFSASVRNSNQTFLVERISPLRSFACGVSGGAPKRPANPKTTSANKQRNLTEVLPLFLLVARHAEPELSILRIAADGASFPPSRHPHAPPSPSGAARDAAVLDGEAPSWSGADAGRLRSAVVIVKLLLAALLLTICPTSGLRLTCTTFSNPRNEKKRNRPVQKNLAVCENKRLEAHCVVLVIGEYGNDGDGDSSIPTGVFSILVVSFLHSRSTCL